jgi:hypothetical protein
MCLASDVTGVCEDWDSQGLARFGVRNGTGGTHGFGSEFACPSSPVLWNDEPVVVCGLSGQNHHNVLLIDRGNGEVKRFANITGCVTDFRRPEYALVGDVLMVMCVTWDEQDDLVVSVFGVDLPTMRLMNGKAPVRLNSSMVAQDLFTVISPLNGGDTVAVATGRIAAGGKDDGDCEIALYALPARIFDHPTPTTIQPVNTGIECARGQSSASSLGISSKTVFVSGLARPLSSTTAILKRYDLSETLNNAFNLTWVLKAGVDPLGSDDAYSSTAIPLSHNNHLAWSQIQGDLRLSQRVKPTIVNMTDGTVVPDSDLPAGLKLNSVVGPLYFQGSQGAVTTAGDQHISVLGSELHSPNLEIGYPYFYERAIYAIVPGADGQAILMINGEEDTLFATARSHTTPPKPNKVGDSKKRRIVVASAVCGSLALIGAVVGLAILTQRKGSKKQDLLLNN